ncbi:MAG: hypothetical protein KAT68_02810 [Bacteroidales bacterium]|nr:hypothetical protein [Bacteroidales bacterium]
MARSTYLYKYLPQKHLDFIKYLDDEGLDIFTLETIREIYKQIDDHNELLENLFHKGIIDRVERGVYVRHNFKDEFVIGSFLTLDATIAYWSALNLHGLTNQIPNTVFVQSTKKKQNKTVFGVYYKFIKVKSQKLTGIQLNGYGNHSYRITDIEKTIVDCFDLPQYAGEFPKLVRAFYETNLNVIKLKNYCESVKNTGVTKKLGFLTELFEKKNSQGFIRYAKSKVTKTINNFDPWGSNEGKIITRWGLRLNMSKEDILNMRNY